MVQRTKATTPIGQRLCQLRKSRKLSQGDIEEKTGLLRCYISRVENGHTIPSLETLQRFAHGLGVSLFEIFYSDDESGAPGDPTNSHTQERAGGSKDAGAFLKRFRDLVPSLSPQDREVLLTLAKKLAGRG